MTTGLGAIAQPSESQSPIEHPRGVGPGRRAHEPERERRERADCDPSLAIPVRPLSALLRRPTWTPTVRI
jgi:hypothetical protein